MTFSDYKLLFDASPNPMWVFHRKTLRYLAANRAAIRLYGYSREEWPKMTLLDIRSPDEARRLKRFFRRPGLPRRGFAGSWRHLRKDGRPIDVEITSEWVSFEGQPAALLVARDVTEKLRAERALERSRELLDSILKNAPEFVTLVDMDGMITFANRIAPGLRRDEVIGRPLVRRLPARHKRLVRAKLQRVLKRGSVETFEAESVSTSGRRWYLTRMGPMRQGGRIVGAVTVSAEITGQRRIEKELEASRQLLDSIMRNAPAVIARLDREGRIQYINHVLPGFEPRKVLGTSTYDYIDPAYRKTAREALERSLRTGRVLSYELRGQGAHGEPRWYRTSVGPLMEGGRTAGTVNISLDITDWKRAQQQLAMTQERLSGLFNASRDAISFIDAQGGFMDVNDAMCRLTGYSRRELLGMNVMDITPAEFQSLSREAMERLSRAGEPSEFEKEYVRKDGSRVPVSLVVFRVGASAGEPPRYAAIIRETTERKRLEKVILEGAAQEQSRLGRELHDSLGQDLTGISLMARTLARRLAKRGGPEAEEARRIAEAAAGAVEHARALAAGLIPSALVSNGLPAALAELAARAERLFGLACAVRCPASLPRLPDIALIHLYRIAQESLTNAAKHGRARRALIEVLAARRALELRVTDDGAGLGAVPETGGMGLAIMRHRARMLGGTLELRRGKLGGAVVSCRVPVRG